jgi:hypothetical protein
MWRISRNRTVPTGFPLDVPMATTRPVEPRGSQCVHWGRGAVVIAVIVKTGGNLERAEAGPMHPGEVLRDSCSQRGLSSCSFGEAPVFSFL